MQRPEFNDMMEAARVSSFIEEAAQGRWRLRKFTVTEEEQRFSDAAAILRSRSQEEINMRVARTVPAGDYICLSRRATDAEIEDMLNDRIADAEDPTPVPDGPVYVPIMSDTPSEIAEHGHAFKHAKGRVLITGLGLGVLVSALLAKPCDKCEGEGEQDEPVGMVPCPDCGGDGKAVKHITVVEIDRDVIALTGPYYADDPRVKVVNMDALGYADFLADRATVGHRDDRFDYAWHDIWTHIASRNLHDDSIAEHGISYRTMFDAYAPFCEKQGAWAYPEAKKQAQVQARERALHREWQHTMLFGTDEEKIDRLFEQAVREHAPQLGTAEEIPEQAVAFFEAQGLREWARGIVMNGGLDLDKIRHDYFNPRAEDPMDRPNEVKEANVAR